MMRLVEVANLGSLLHRLVRARRGARHIGRRLGWAMGGDLLGKAALLGTTIAVARALSPHFFALYIALSAVAMVAAGVWDFGLSTLLTREVASGETSPRSALRDVARLRLLTLPVWCGVFTGGFLLTGAPSRAAFVIPFALGSAIFASHAPVLAAMRAEMRFSAVAASWASGRLVTMAMTICLAFVGSNSMPLFGWSFAVGELATATLAVGALCRARPWLAPRRTPLRLRRAVPLAANGLLSLAYNRLDVVLLPALSAATELAKYAPASRLQDALYLIPVAFGSVGLPVMAGRVASEGRQSLGPFMAKLASVAFLVSLPITAIVELLAPTVVETLLGGGYAGSVSSVRIVVCFLPFSAASAPLLAGLIAVGRSFDTTRIFALSFGLSLALHFLLDPKFGAIGASVATLGRDVVALPYAVALVRRAGLSATRAGLDVRPTNVAEPTT